MHYTRELAAEAHAMARATGHDRDEGLAIVMARELNDICARLAEADIRVRQPLGQARLSSLLHSMYDPDHPIDHIQAMTQRNAWPAELDATEPTFLQAKTRESSTRAPWCHATAWVKEWPMTPVGVNFLAPLLVHTPDVIRTVAVTMDLEPTDVAIERMLTEKTNDDAEASRAAKMNRVDRPPRRRPHRPRRPARRGPRLRRGGRQPRRLHHRLLPLPRGPGPRQAHHPRLGGQVVPEAGVVRPRAPPGVRQHAAVRYRHPPLRRLRHGHAGSVSALTDAFTSFLFGKVETTRLPVRTSTGQAQAVYLPTAAPGLGDSGVIIGREVYSGKGYIYDPFQLYGQQLPAPHWLVLGESGNGKSALEKTYVLRQLRFRDRQVVVLDAQGEDGVGEWNLIAQELGITPIRLDPMAALDGGIKLNPLDPAITTTGQLALLRTIIEVALGHGLDERSGFALKVAHAHVVESITERQPILTDIVERLRHPAEESAEAMNVDLDDVRAWGLDVALVLDRLVDGDLRGMFDGPTTAGIDLDAPLIVFDLSHIDRNSIAMPILMAIVGVWLEHTWIRPDRIKRIFLVEEAWHIINCPFVAQLFQRLLKFGRRLGLSFVAVVHHLSDVVDGAAAKEAAAILKMASTRTVYAQKADEARATGRVLGLPRWAVEIIPTLTPGIAVWDVNGNVQVVKHLITEAERPLVFTDRAMTEASADMEHENQLARTEAELALEKQLADDAVA